MVKATHIAVVRSFHLLDVTGYSRHVQVRLLSACYLPLAADGVRNSIFGSIPAHEPKLAQLVGQDLALDEVRDLDAILAGKAAAWSLKEGVFQLAELGDLVSRTPPSMKTVDFNERARGCISQDKGVQPRPHLGHTLFSGETNGVLRANEVPRVGRSGIDEPATPLTDQQEVDSTLADRTHELGQAEFAIEHGDSLWIVEDPISEKRESGLDLLVPQSSHGW